MGFSIVLHEVPADSHGYCGGRDQVDSECTCPDFVVTVRTRIKNGSSVMVFNCFCCKLPIDRDHIPPGGRGSPQTGPLL